MISQPLSGCYSSKYKTLFTLVKLN